MKPQDEPDAELLKKLQLLQETPERSPERAAQGKAAFLSAAKSTQTSVTDRKKLRHSLWKRRTYTDNLNTRKENLPVFNTLTSVLLAIGLLLGGGGAATAAAQTSQPDQPLYAVKLISEDLRLDLASNPQAKVQLALDFADRRVAEIESSTESGEVLPASVEDRYQSQIQAAIQNATGLPDEQAIQALEQVRVRLQSQQKAILAAESTANPQALQSVQRSREMINERLAWVEQGLQNLPQLREKLNQGNGNQGEDKHPGKGPKMPDIEPTASVTAETPEPSATIQPTASGTPSPTSTVEPTVSATPESTSTVEPTASATPKGGNPWVTGTPMPGFPPGLSVACNAQADHLPGLFHQSINVETVGTAAPGSAYASGHFAVCLPGLHLGWLAKP